MTTRPTNFFPTPSNDVAVVTGNSEGSVQYRGSFSSLGGSPEFTYNETTQTLTVPNLHCALVNGSATGIQGPQGIQGLQGMQGDQGAQGDTGAQGANGISTIIFSSTGGVSPTVGTARWYPSVSSTLANIYATIGVPSSSGDVVCSLNLNGASLATVTINQGVYKSNVVQLTTVLTANDYITMDIISGTSGSDVYAMLSYN